MTDAKVEIPASPFHLITPRDLTAPVYTLLSDLWSSMPIMHELAAAVVVTWHSVSGVIGTLRWHSLGVFVNGMWI